MPNVILIQHAFTLDIKHKVMNQGLIQPKNITLSTQVGKHIHPAWKKACR